PASRRADRGRPGQGRRIRTARRRARARGPRHHSNRGGRGQDAGSIRRESADRSRNDDGRRCRDRPPPRPARRRGRSVACLFQLRHVSGLQPPGGGLSRRPRARRRRGAPPVKPPVKRPVIRRVASPEASALKARAAAERAKPVNRIKAGALEVWSSITAWLTRMRGDGTPARPIRPSEVGVDRILVGAVLALAAIGVVMVYSSGDVFAAKKYGDATYFLKRELVYAVLGLGALSLATRVDYSIYRKLAYPLLGFSRRLLAAVLKIGSRAGGAIRWFRLGPLSFQPGELAKLALCVYLASLLARKAEKVRVFSVGFLPPLLVTGVMMVLLLKQPDFGTAAIF